MKRLASETIEELQEEIAELKKTTIPISKIEELDGDGYSIPISDFESEWYILWSDVEKLIKEVKGND